jgi:hypothetical protein
LKNKKYLSDAYKTTSKGFDLFKRRYTTAVAMATILMEFQDGGYFYFEDI